MEAKLGSQFNEAYEARAEIRKSVNNLSDQV